jgi:glycosyltransferase involved in cell wall biosynthesis
MCYADGPPPDELSELFGRFISVDRPERHELRGLDRVFRVIDPEQLAPSSEHLKAVLMDLLRSGGYDLVWVSGWDTIVNLPRPAPVRVLADAVDDGVLEWWRRFCQTRGLLPRARVARWLLLNIGFERRYFGAADGVLFVSELDASVFGRLCPKTPTFVVHNGVDVDFFRPLELPVEPDLLVFEGNMGFEPNVEAAVYFVRQVLPLILARRPVRLILVGSRPDPKVTALSSDHVVVTGFVDDVRPYVGRAAAFVCPMLSGAGIKNKILQAWAMGKAVVSTHAATGGLAAMDEHNILVADGAQPFADAVLRALSDASLRERLGANGRQTVLDRYTWTAKAAELEKVFEGVANVVHASALGHA